MKRPFHQVITSTIIVVVATIGTDVHGDVTARLEALPDPVLLSGYLAESEAKPVTEIAIRQGDPLALRITLHNDSDKPSEPIAIDLNRHGRPAMMIVDADGKEHVEHFFTGVRRFPPAAKVMDAGEKAIVDVYVYHRRNVDEFGRDRGWVYAFPKPGTYRVYYRKYIDEHPFWRAKRGLPVKEEPQPPLESNHVTVHVGPPIPGWEQLKEVGLVNAISGTQFVWPQAFESPERQREIERLIAIADRPWLTRWFEDVKEYRRKREEERKRQEEERQRLEEERKRDEQERQRAARSGDDE